MRNDIKLFQAINAENVNIPYVLSDNTIISNHKQKIRERSGSVVECLTRDCVASGSSIAGVTVLCPCTRHINPSLVLVQPRKTRPFITERLLMGCKESNQTKKMSKK